MGGSSGHPAAHGPDRDPLAGAPLVGAGHHAALQALCKARDRTLHQWRPRMVNLMSETGVGKTRIVQELYRHVVADDPYWPRELTAANQRKAVVPQQDAWPGRPKVLWIGLSCWQGSDGSPGRALDAALRRQLRAHARALIVRERRTKAVRKAFAKAVLAITPLLGVSLVSDIAEALDTADDTREIAASIQSAAATGDDSNSDRQLVEAAIGLANLVNADGMSMVVVLDDAHDADATTLAAVERLLESARGVLVVATSWPTAIERQRAGGRGFGAWLQWARPTRPDRVATRAAAPEG